MVGDLSDMYDEVDPALACEMGQKAIRNLPQWTGGRLRDVIMTYAGGQVQWGKATRDSRPIVDLELLMQMAIFNCKHTLYKFRGMVNRRLGCRWVASWVTSFGSHNLIDGGDQDGTWTRPYRRSGSLHG